jgi:RecA/RadA recombinase
MYRYSLLGTAAFIDAEHALDPIYARNLGVNVEVSGQLIATLSRDIVPQHDDEQLT